jgi:uncharacterized protein (DUF3084 family)
MERAVAIKKLGKILGKSLGYQVDPKAPNRDEREAARAECMTAVAERQDLKERMEVRRKVLLDADAEYQALKADYEKVRDRADLLGSISRRYRITVGTSSSMFFHVRAEGDSWEEVIGKLTAKKQAA